MANPKPAPKKGPTPNAEAYEHANANARFKRPAGQKVAKAKSWLQNRGKRPT